MKRLRQKKSYGKLFLGFGIDIKLDDDSYPIQ